MISAANASVVPDAVEPNPLLDPAELAGEGTRRFAAVTGHLHDLRDMQTALIRDLEDYSNIVGEDDGASTDNIEYIGNAAKTMNEVLAAIAARLGDDKALQDLRDVKGYLHVVIRISQSLSAISKLTRTTAASHAITALNGYTQQLSLVAAEIRNRAEEVSDHTEELADRMNAMKKQIGNAQEVVFALVQVANTAIADGSEIARDSGRAAQTIQANAQALTESIKDKFKRFVSAIQFSDRLSQRLEHLTLILSHEDPYAQRLSAAQARDIAEHLREKSNDIRDLLDGLGDLGRSGMEIFVSSEIANEAERILEARSAIIGTIAQKVDRARQVLDSVRDDVAVGKRLVVEASVAFESLETSSKTVGHASMNSTLLAARSGVARGPLATLSVAVRECASQCLAAVGGSKLSLNAFFARLADGMEDLLEAGDRLEVSLGKVKEAVAKGNGRLDRLNALRIDARERADRILGLLAEAAASNVAMGSIAEQLDLLAEAVDGPQPEVAPDPDLLARIWDLYTMDDERVVHAKMFAGELPSESDRQPAANIDDLLF